jgi:hypothetical protein
VIRPNVSDDVIGVREEAYRQIVPALLLFAEVPYDAANPG